MRLVRLFILANLLVFLAHPVLGLAADRNCTAEESEQADQQLRLNKHDRDAAIKRHLPFGLPVADQPTDHERLLVQRDYVIAYDGDLRGPLWTAHQLKAAKGEKSDRINCFRRDVRLDADLAATKADYDEPLFDQGHLAPNADFSGSGDMAVVNSFILSNMAPQYCQFNRGVWQILEQMTRNWSNSLGMLYVISGSIYDRDSNRTRDEDGEAWHMKSRNGKQRVAIPSDFFKIILHPLGNGRAESIAFILPHDRTDLAGEAAATYLAKHVVPIATIEKVTGVTFFKDRRMLNDETKTGDIWDYGERVPATLVKANCREAPQGMR